MPRLITIFFILFLTLTTSVIFPAVTWADAPQSGHLEACPPSPNCVTSESADEKHAIEPITYNGSRDTARKTLLKVLSVIPRTEVIEENNRYIHALAKSRVFGFIDDVEFYFPKHKNIIMVRSASRVGESDLGVNRRRIEQIRLALQDLNEMFLTVTT